MDNASDRTRLVVAAFDTQSRMSKQAPSKPTWELDSSSDYEDALEKQPSPRRSLTERIIELFPEMALEQDSTAPAPVCIVSVKDVKGVKKDIRLKKELGIIKQPRETVGAWLGKLFDAKKELENMNDAQKLAWLTDPERAHERKLFKTGFTVHVEVDNNFRYPILKVIITLNLIPSQYCQDQLVVELHYGIHNVKFDYFGLRIRNITDHQMLDQDGYPGFPIDNNIKSNDIGEVFEVEIDVLAHEKLRGRNLDRETQEYGVWKSEIAKVQSYRGRDHVLRLLFINDNRNLKDGIRLWAQLVQTKEASARRREFHEKYRAEHAKPHRR